MQAVGCRTDLIETLWNVKVNPAYLAVCPRYDLIETLWNVKISRSNTSRIATTGFNRDIVECKEMYLQFNRCYPVMI